MNTRLCKHCQQEFILTRPDKLFCSRKCKIKAKDKRLNRNVVKVNRKRHPYRAFKKNFCECCGFIPTHPCQLDVDHVDGDHLNNDPNNLQTLCANCHRLKTFLNKDWE